MSESWLCRHKETHVPSHRSPPRYSWGEGADRGNLASPSSPGVAVRAQLPLEYLRRLAPSSLVGARFWPQELGYCVRGDRSRAPKRFAQVIEEVAQEGSAARPALFSTR